MPRRDGEGFPANRALTIYRYLFPIPWEGANTPSRNHASQFRHFAVVVPRIAIPGCAKSFRLQRYMPGEGVGDAGMHPRSLTETDEDANGN
jgi:hypothetical protein